MYLAVSTTNTLFAIIAMIVDINTVVKITGETLFMKQHEAETLEAASVEFCLQGKVIKDS